MKNKRYEIMLSIITIMTVLTTAVGVTFSYFTNSMTGTAADISATTDLIGGIKFEGGTNFEDATDIEPGWMKSKTFTITVAPSNHEQVVKVKMDYTNGFTDLVGEVTEVSNGAIGSFSLEKNTPENTDEFTKVLVDKTFPASSEVQTITYTLTMKFPETDSNQNYDQGKEFNATLYADLGSSGLYFNDQNPNGTNTKPDAQ